MKKLLIISFAVLLFSSCATVSNRFIVTNLGYEPVERLDSYIYTLPKTSFKVSVTYEKQLVIPGPYADYALKLLGIENVPKERQKRFSISDYEIKAFSAPDNDQYYSISSLEGRISERRINWLAEKNLILYGDYTSRTMLAYPMLESSKEEIHYKDLGIEKNIEKKKQTIYKTIITDTSFVKVPVTTEHLQRKTLEKKAEEAASLILEIRSDRYFLAAGMVDPYPDNFDLKTAIESLDKLENEYLSLFIGKELIIQETIEYDVTPLGALDDEHFELDMFTQEDGPGQFEGESLILTVSPSGGAQSRRNLLPQEPEEEAYNRIYYRIPEVVDVYLSLGSKILHKEKVSIFQSGALVNEIIQ